MSEKRVYQDKMLNSKKKIVVCNWERGKGKTYSIFQKIIEEKNGKYLYISPFESNVLQDYFKEYIQKESKNIKAYDKRSRNEICIEFNNGNRLEVFCYKPNNEPRALKNIKITFFDEYCPSKEYVDMIKAKSTEQIYIMMTNDNIEYIDSRIGNEDFNVKDFYEIQIKELMMEYSSVSKNEKTTLTRENILKQIKVLQDMKKNNSDT